MKKRKKRVRSHSLQRNNEINYDEIETPRNKLTPQQIAIAFGLLANALRVNSVLIDSNQRLQFVVTGSLDEMINYFKDLGLKSEDVFKIFEK